MTAEAPPRTGFEWRCILYRFWDADRNLLYVGQTANIQLRFDQHRWHQPWWDEVADATIEWLPDAASLTAAEREAIWTERPRYNRQLAHPDVYVVHPKSLPRSLQLATGHPFEDPEF